MAFESFAVICETCGARLRVRDAALIGEIHACPKCESMVQVLPPAGWQTASTAPSVVQSAVPEEAPPTAVEPPGAVELPTAEGMPTMQFVDAATAPPTPATPTVYPLVLGAIGGAALVMVGVAAVMWARGDESLAKAPAATAAASSGAGNRATAPTTEAAPAAEGAKTLPIEPQANESSEAALAKADPAEDPLSATAELPAPPELPEPVAELPPQEVTAEPAAEAATAEPPPSGDAAEAAPDTQPVLKFDPLDFDPSRLSLRDQGAPAATTSAGSIGAVASEPAIEREAPAEPIAEEILARPPQREPSLYVRRGPRPSRAAGPSKLGEQLLLRVESLEVRESPLTGFVAMVSDLAGAPISLDPRALELAGVAPQAAVAVEGQDATLESLLREALSSRRLECIEEGGGLRVVLKDAPKWRAMKYNVADLAEGGDASTLAPTVVRFVAPTQWQAAGGKGKIRSAAGELRVEQSQEVHHEILVFCERLRLARGLQPRSRYPAERLSIDALHEPATAKLNQKTTFTFLPSTRLRDVMQYWQEASGLTILVDWTALSSAGLGPQSTLACSANDRRWAEAFDGILAPLELDWWVVNGGTLAITSRAAIDSIARVEFYALPEALRDQFASEELLVESLAGELREQASGVPLAMAVDAPSGRLIVRGSPRIHRLLRERLGSAPGAGAVAGAAVRGR